MKGYPQILVVEDESIVALEVKSRLQGLGYEVVAIVDTGQEAIDHAVELRPDLVLMDINLKGAMDGVEAAEVIQEQYLIPVVFLTANTDRQTFQRAKLSGPFGYILKPFQERELQTVIEIALYKNKKEQDY